MSAGYVVARENFKEAAKHVSAEADPVMFNLLYGLQSLTNQIEADFASLGASLPGSGAPPPKGVNRKKKPGKNKKKPVKSTRK